MIEFSRPEPVDPETKARLHEAWKGLAAGFVAHTGRTKIPINTAFVMLDIGVGGPVGEFKAQVFPVFVSEAETAPPNLQLLLIKGDTVLLATGAQFSWHADLPEVINTFNLQTSGLRLTNERLIGLINTIGATVEQPHNTL